MTEELRQSRLRLERSLESLRGAVRSELGWAPPAGRWSMLLVAAAVGFAAGARLAARRRLRAAASDARDGVELPASSAPARRRRRG